MKNSFRRRTALYTAPGNGSNDDDVKTVRSKVIENLIFSGENSRRPSYFIKSSNGKYNNITLVTLSP